MALLLARCKEGSVGTGASSEGSLDSEAVGALVELEKQRLVLMVR